MKQTTDLDSIVSRSNLQPAVGSNGTEQICFFPQMYKFNRKLYMPFIFHPVDWKYTDSPTESKSLIRSICLHKIWQTVLRLSWARTFPFERWCSPLWLLICPFSLLLFPNSSFHVEFLAIQEEKRKVIISYVAPFLYVRYWWETLGLWVRHLAESR